MSTIVVLKEADTLFFGTDSRFMAHDFSGVVSDTEQKIFEIAPNTFIATSGRKRACDFQVARARELAAELGTSDIQAIGAALEGESFPCLSELVERLRLEPDERTRQAVSGESLLHGCMLVGRTGGKLGYVAHSYHVQAGGTIKCETEAYFEARRKITATSGAPVPVFMGVVSRFAQDMATWTDSPEQVVVRLLEAMKQSAPTIGGPNQLVCLDDSGAHWISRPPRAAVPIVGTLACATITALVSLISPVVSGGSITGATIAAVGAQGVVSIDPSFPRILLTCPGTNFQTRIESGVLYVELISGSRGVTRVELSPYGITVRDAGGSPVAYMANDGTGHFSNIYTKTEVDAALSARAVHGVYPVVGGFVVI